MSSPTGDMLRVLMSTAQKHSGTLDRFKHKNYLVRIQKKLMVWVTITMLTGVIKLLMDVALCT